MDGALDYIQAVLCLHGFILVLSFVHLVLNHSSAYTVFYLQGCFSKVSKNRINRGPAVSGSPSQTREKNAYNFTLWSIFKFFLIFCSLIGNCKTDFVHTQEQGPRACRRQEQTFPFYYSQRPYKAQVCTMDNMTKNSKKRGKAKERRKLLIQAQWFF